MNRRDFVAAGATAVCLCVLGAEDAHAAPSGGTIDVGQLADYPADLINDKFTKSGKIFVVRSGGQIFALNAICTHKGCLLGKKENAIKCRCHGSQFSEHGTVTGGPAKASLFRYAIKLDDQNHLIVDKSRQFAEKDWADSDSFVKIT